VATAPTATATRPATGKQQFLDTFEREHRTTMRVLRAYPTDKLDLKPHTLCKTAKELGWMFTMEQRMSQLLMTTGLDLSKPMTPPAVPESWDAVLAAFEEGHRDVVRVVEQMSPEQLAGTTKFFVAPKTMGDVPKMDLLWMLLHDQIHHRGQLSIYLRMAGGKVPSIYGPTADEPWM
jgi:uncharacterized damage-inducible protein DinB